METPEQPAGHALEPDRRGPIEDRAKRIDGPDFPLFHCMGSFQHLLKSTALPSAGPSSDHAVDCFDPQIDPRALSTRQRAPSTPGLRARNVCNSPAVVHTILILKRWLLAAIAVWTAQRHDVS
jgi:hypothetical protein